MSVASILSGSPAGVASVGPISANAITSVSGEALTVASGAGLFLKHAPGGFGVNVGNTDGSGTTHLSISSDGYSFVQWLNLDAPAVPPRNTYEDWGYAPAALALPPRRYTQYSESIDCSGSDGGAVLLNWGMLDPARLGVVDDSTAGPVAVPSITAADVVLFTPKAIAAGDAIVAPTYTIQPGVSFTLSNPIPPNEEWNYLVIRAGGPNP